MGKSLKGKELGQGISQRKDGRYQARFTNRFGQRQTIYAKTLGEIRKMLCMEQYEDEKRMNASKTNMTLNEWYDIWMETYKQNCRNTTRADYAVSYNRIRNSLGWRKLGDINLIIMQQAFNELKTDHARKTTKQVLVDILDRAVSAELLAKNVARSINTIVNHDMNNDERRVLSLLETEEFLEAAADNRYFNLFCLMLETGLRVGEALALKWSDVNYYNQILYVRRTLVYVARDGRMVYEFHETKTKNGRRKIPLTAKALEILDDQKKRKTHISARRAAAEGFEDLIFVSKNNAPISSSDVNVEMHAISERVAEEDLYFRPVSPHALRHSFATRCIERGMNPKTLQIIMGHASISITMNLYCHVTEDTLFAEMKKFESGENRGVKMV